MDIGGFIGRFHPLFVHLPIGFLLLAGIFEYFARKPKYQKLNHAVAFTLFIGALFAILSSISGWLLANRGAYIEQSLFLHRWLGIGVSVFATLCFLIKTNQLKLSNGIFNGLLTMMILGIFATGHFGGNMTHGEDYLTEYAPTFIQNIFKKEKQEQVLTFDQPKDIKVYADLLSPILENQCWKCHNPDNPLGSLDMTTKASFIKGGFNGAIVENGDAYQSELFRRITLPASDRKAMPPAGLLLPYNQIRLIEWWINTGASFEKPLGDFELSSDIKNLLSEEYAISFIEKSAIESIEAPVAAASDISILQEHGFLVNAIAANNNLLEISAKDKAFSQEQFASLAKLKDQITWLDLNACNLSDTQLSIIANLKNLTRLRLNKNPITNLGIQQLENLTLLESLSLVGTEITDDALASIQKLVSLKTLYIWETKVSNTAIETLQNQNPDLEVVKGFQFKKPEK